LAATREIETSTRLLLAPRKGAVLTDPPRTDRRRMADVRGLVLRPISLISDTSWRSTPPGHTISI